MEFCKIVFLLIILNFCFVNCTPVSSKNEIEEIGERISKLELENYELRLENDRLKLEIIRLKQENITASNLIEILPEIKNFTEKVYSLWKDVKPLKEYLNNITENVSNNNLKQIIPEEQEIKEPAWPTNCEDAANGTSGVYTIEFPNSGLEPFPVVCDAETQYGGWTIVQHRFDGSVDFYRPWSEYKTGFGTISVNDEFYIGNEKLHKLTSTEAYELLIVLEDFNRVTKYAKYDKFVIGSEAEKYELKELGTYSGTAGDSLYLHEKDKFSTFDSDNDSNSSSNCAEERHGAWWYSNCAYSNLNGKYYSDGDEDESDSMNWFYFHPGHYSLKSSKMMIRPSAVPEMCKRFSEN